MFNNNFGGNMSKIEKSINSARSRLGTYSVQCELCGEVKNKQLFRRFNSFNRSCNACHLGKSKKDDKKDEF
jgi:uncharacterized protein (DUF983 family)